VGFKLILLRLLLLHQGLDEAVVFSAGSGAAGHNSECVRKSAIGVESEP